MTRSRRAELSASPTNPGFRTGHGIPLYRQIERTLAAQIRRGTLPVGGAVPSEAQICERFGVSHITARRAILELQQRGLIYRRKGRGTFVAERVHRARLTLLFAGFDADRWQWTASSMGDLVGGITEVAWRHSCTLDIVRLDTALDASGISHVLAERETDGLLVRLAGDASTEHVDLLDSTGIPYVLLRRYVPGRAVSCVVPADDVGTRLAVAHLAQLGHWRIGLVTALPDMVLTQDRLRGFRAATATFDLARDEQLVCLGDRYDPAAGRRCAAQLLTVAPRPTAVIVDTDMAPGVYEAAAELGLDIPGDLAVVGYDDTPAARGLMPRLTCIRTSHYETGRVAAEALLGVIGGTEQRTQRLVIEPVLEIRASCGAAVRSPSRTTLSQLGELVDVQTHSRS